MKIIAMVEVELPDGTTHYAGELTDEPECYKLMTMSSTAGPQQYWCIYSRKEKTWKIDGFSYDGKPRDFMKAIPSQPIKII